jgi:signal transduction histidine kinase
MFFLTASVAVVYGSENTGEAKALVEKAATFMKSQGKEKALGEISKRQGQFDKGELYVFAYDMNGTMLAHPINPKLVGKNLLEVPDNDGKLFRKEIIEKAKTKGSGWVDYTYLNPDTKKVEAKTTYLLKVNDVVLCCGAYK